MKKIIVLAIVLVLAIPAAAWAEQYFSLVEKGKICSTVTKLLPGVGVLYHNTCIGSVGILIGPLPDEEGFIFIYANAKGEIFIYQPSVKHEAAAKGILKVVSGVVDNRPASDPRSLGRNLIK